MILCYCHENLSEGLALLRLNAGSRHLPSIYALALILRDSRRIESDYYLNLAASLGYAPAWQEKLTAAEMRVQVGDLDAVKLARYLDSPCLNRLMGRHYLECQRVRKHQTSHCWNPLCGRWAYKRDGGARHHAFEPTDANDDAHFGEVFSIEPLLPQQPAEITNNPAHSSEPSPLGKIRQALRNRPQWSGHGLKVSRMKMCSSCRRAKYCSKLCQVYDWRSNRHKMECHHL